MKLLSSKRRMAVIGLTVGLIAGASGLAVAYLQWRGHSTWNFGDRLTSRLRTFQMSAWHVV